FGHGPSAWRWRMTALSSLARTETAQCGVSPIVVAHSLASLIVETLSRKHHRRARSKGSTFLSPALCACGSSNPWRRSRLETTERARRKASFRLLVWRRAILKKESPKYVHLALSSHPNDEWLPSAAVITSVSTSAMGGMKTPE